MIVNKATEDHIQQQPDDGGAVDAVPVDQSTKRKKHILQDREFT